MKILLLIAGWRWMAHGSHGTIHDFEPTLLQTRPRTVARCWIAIAQMTQATLRFLVVGCSSAPKVGLGRACDLGGVLHFCRTWLMPTHESCAPTLE